MLYVYTLFQPHRALLPAVQSLSLRESTKAHTHTHTLGQHPHALATTDVKTHKDHMKRVRVFFKLLIRLLFTIPKIPPLNII